MVFVMCLVCKLAMFTSPRFVNLLFRGWVLAPIRGLTTLVLKVVPASLLATKLCLANVYFTMFAIHVTQGFLRHVPA